MNAFRHRKQTDDIYTDFSKAFDQVNHAILIRIVTDYSFGEHLLSWFGFNLINRQQCVKLHGVKL